MSESIVPKKEPGPGATTSESQVASEAVAATVPVKRQRQQVSSLPRDMLEGEKEETRIKKASKSKRLC